MSGEVCVKCGESNSRMFKHNGEWYCPLCFYVIASPGWKQAFKNDAQLEEKWTDVYQEYTNNNHIPDNVPEDEEERMFSGGMVELPSGSVHTYSYLNALESRQKAIKDLSKDHSALYLGSHVVVLPPWKTPEDQLLFTIKALKESNLYFVSSHAISLIKIGMETIPDFDITPDLFLTKNGWLHLETPFDLPDPIAHGYTPKLASLHWFDVKGLYVAVKFYLTYDFSARAIPARTFAWQYGAKSLSTESYMSAHINHHSEGVDGTEASEKGLQTSANFVLACLCFMRQPILGFSLERINRAMRKRFEKEYKEPPPEIKVIELRAKQYITKDDDSAEAKDIEWTCHWLVRGHWRHFHLQPKPPIWITPYIKGDLDKPLKEPKGTIFEVSR